MKIVILSDEKRARQRQLVRESDGASAGKAEKKMYNNNTK